jgi:transcriptional regulator with XRE-family HTH domain
MSVWLLRQATSRADDRCPAAVLDLLTATPLLGLGPVSEGSGALAGVQFRGAVLRRARELAGLTQAELAFQAGVFDDARVRSWERGAEQPSAAKVSRLARALGIDALELYGGDPARPPLALLRRVAGLTLMELARQTGLTYARCQRIEQGIVEPTTTDITSLANALGVTVAQLKQSVTHSACGSDQKPDG